MSDRHTLYLVQHGEPKKKEDDPTQPLTERGRREVTAVASAAVRLGLDVGIIGHSEKLRAKETAEIIASALVSMPNVQEQSWLGGDADPSHAAGFVQEANVPVMLVGHLPHLSKLASLILVGHPERKIIDLRMGGIVALVQQALQWRIRWMLVPELTQ